MNPCIYVMQRRISLIASAYQFAKNDFSLRYFSTEL